MHQQDNPARPFGVRAPEPVRAYAAMNTVRALECLAFAALSAPELAASLQVSVRTARRLLQRLALEGFVTQERGHRRRYQATLRLAALGRQLLDHAPVTRAAAPRVARLAQDTGAVAHLWIAGYDAHVVCAVHADGRAGNPAASLLSEVTSASSTAAGTVLLRDRAQLRSCCYIGQTAEPTFAAAVLEHGSVVAALGLTGDTALQDSGAVVTVAARLSTDLSSRRYGQSGPTAMDP
jgi:DNA-binding MarR family transcriptional regulator